LVAGITGMPERAPNCATLKGIVASALHAAVALVYAAPCPCLRLPCPPFLLMPTAPAWAIIGPKLITGSRGKLIQLAYKPFGCV